MSQLQKDEIVVEVDIDRIIDDPKLGRIAAGNGDYMFHPIGQNLRSRIIPQRSRVGYGPVWNSIPSIPGQRIHLDMKARVGRITDALADPENDRIFTQVQSAYQQDPKIVRPITGGGPLVPQKELEFRNLSQEEVLNWAYWMRRAVDSGFAKIVQNGDKLQSEAELRKTGQIRIPGEAAVAKAEFGGVYMKPDIMTAAT